jgi:hypothetical protein
MFCKLFFSYKKNRGYETILQELKKTNASVQIITNDLVLKKELKKNGFESKIFNKTPFDQLFEEKIYENSKSIQKTYLEKFQNISCHEIEVFKGFDYSFLLQLTILNKAKNILEKKKNTIFVFNGFFDIYFVIIELAKKLGFETDLNLRNIEKNKITFIRNSNDKIDSQKKVSSQKIMSYLKNASKDNSAYSLKSILIVITRILSMSIKSTMYKHKKLEKIDLEQLVFKKIDKKIKKTNIKEIKTLFFATTSREDLYLRPWYPVLKIYKQKKINYLIFTSDLTTSLVLSKTKIPFINLFEEVKILERGLKNTEYGEKINNKILEICNKNNSILGINELKSYLTNQIFRSIAVIIICEHIVNKIQPISIAAIADGEMLEKIAINVAEQNNVKHATILVSQISKEPILSDWFNAKNIFVHGIEGKEVLEKLGYKKSSLIITGNPKFDYLKNMDVGRAKKKIEKLHHIDSNKKLILIGMGRWHKEDDVWMSNLIKFAKKNNFEIIIKIHPAYKIQGQKESEMFIKNINEYSKNDHYIITYDMDLPTLISAADLVITEYSSVGVEAILLDKPLITFNPLKENFEHFLRYDSYDASIYIEDYSILEKTILEILISKKYLGQLKSGRIKISEQLNYLNDGKSAERIFKNLTL